MLHTLEMIVNKTTNFTIHWDINETVQNKNYPRHNNFYKITCAFSEDSDQPAQTDLCSRYTPEDASDPLLPTVPLRAALNLCWTKMELLCPGSNAISSLLGQDKQDMTGPWLCFFIGPWLCFSIVPSSFFFFFFFFEILSYESERKSVFKVGKLMAYASLIVQWTLFIQTLDTTTKFVIMTKLRSRADI